MSDNAVSLDTESPAVPEWVRARDRRNKPSRKRKISERVFNPCLCYSYAATGKAPTRRAVRPATAYDLCQCQIQRAFDRSYPTHHPAIECRGLFALDCTDEDREHVEWVCMLNLGEWVPEADRGFLPADRDGLDLTAIFAMLHLARDDRERIAAESCPPLAELREARASGNYTRINAARDALALWERVALLRRLGVSEAMIERYTTNESRLGTHYTH